MEFDEAFILMKKGSKIKLPTWDGYWFWDKEKETIMIHTKCGKDINPNSLYDKESFYDAMRYDNWEIIEEDNDKPVSPTSLSFEEAISLVKTGKKLTRIKWRDLKPLGIDVYIIKGHHNPERFSLDYNQLPETDAIYKVSGTSKKIYNPSPMDIFADDWVLA